MRKHRFFISEEPKNYTPGNQIEIDDQALVHQWNNVFRMEEGREVIVLDNSRFEYEAAILKLEKNKAVIEILSKKKSEIEQKLKILLCQAVIKKDNFEWIVQKCTELGVEEFVPLIAERSEKKNLNIERLRVIGKEAAEQSGRAFITKIHEPVTLEDALAGTKNDSIVFDASGSPLHNSSAIIHNSCSVFIGPEGGWSERELELFKQRGVKIFSLGNATLRAETAAISASALMLL